MIYNIIISEEADKDIRLLKKNEPKVYQKLVKLLFELQEHPMSGTGHPKPLGGDKSGQWSRRITNKHRLIYMIEKEKIYVYVLSAYGHYDDK
ncbi:toxin YoeB [Parabacteroides sp. PFB2-12]|uniref:Txe/YoeB family addiction module toxin n=1 Tax=unclassified Parabacteroides TaxID=2649774 RepID=UPI002475BDFD|nr:MULTISPECIES: Txe/YoeB family addiction module toxin [unclassified Parabacteroides]MDH6342852.1 toxin YoeB [Parabacteroides sp. PM6-13]MDH6390518.1 toxin YoeB [Parabacteroides sp. PFB2-12]